MINLMESTIDQLITYITINWKKSHELKILNKEKIHDIILV